MALGGTWPESPISRTGSSVTRPESQMTLGHEHGVGSERLEGICRAIFVEAQAWQTRARAQEATAAALQKRLQQAIMSDDGGLLRISHHGRRAVARNERRRKAAEELAPWAARGCALSGIRLGDNLEGNVADCLVGTVDGSANGEGLLEVKLGKSVPTVGSMGLENSIKFDASPGKDVFVLGICI